MLVLRGLRCTTPPSSTWTCCGGTSELRSALVPIGMAAAIVLTQVRSQLRDIYYSISIMPVLFPGVIIGISTVVLWDRIAGLGGDGLISDVGRNGIFLTILAQTCFISTYCFLIFVARLQRFDQTQEEAALDLGATQTQVFFKILVPYLMPAIASAAATILHRKSITPGRT